VTSVYQYAPPQGWGYYASGLRVSLQSFTGRFLVEESGQIYTENQHCGERGTWIIRHLYEDVVEIQSAYNGKYVAVDGSQVYLANQHHEYDTLFHLEHIDGRVAFRVKNHNKYIGVHTFEHKVHATHERSMNELFLESTSF